MTRDKCRCRCCFINRKWQTCNRMNWSHIPKMTEPRLLWPELWLKLSTTPELWRLHICLPSALWLGLLTGQCTAHALLHPLRDPPPVIPHPYLTANSGEQQSLSAPSLGQPDDKSCYWRRLLPLPSHVPVPWGSSYNSHCSTALTTQWCHANIRLNKRVTTNLTTHFKPPWLW